MSPPLVPPRARKPSQASPVFPIRRTPEFELALTRALTALTAAGEVLPMRDGKPIIAEIVVAALGALADRAERRATKNRQGNVE